MENLPLELLSKIMLYLPLEDRLTCSLTCRRWAEAMTSPQLLHDVWLDIAGHEIKRATSVLANTQRQYPKLLVYNAGLSEFEFEFWGKIGENLRVLELKECRWSTHVFYAILQQCTKLESLRIVDDVYEKTISISDFVLPARAGHEKLRDSLSNLRHLHLNIDVTAEILDLLLGLMPNVTSIFLSVIDTGPDFLERLPSILEKNRITRTEASLRRMDIDEIIKFMEITSGSLEELLIVMRKDQFTSSACDAIANCTKLRRFELRETSSSFDASHLERLVSNSPDLETLEFFADTSFHDEGMVRSILSKLKKLRSLTPGACFGFNGPDVFLCSLGEISTLVKLDFSFSCVDSRVMQSLGRLRNLRSLVLGSCKDSECFEAICENFEGLTELDLGYVNDLTDADGTKLRRFKELRNLSFTAGYGFTDLTFERGVGSRAMKSLRIGNCSTTDAGLASIASHHDRLENLYLGGCKNVTEAGILALLQKEPRLKYLDSDISLQHIEPAALENLCPRVREWPTDDAMDFIYCSDSE